MMPPNANSSILDISPLLLNGDFDNQLQEILEYIRMTRNEVEALQLLFNDLQEIFGSRWQGSQLEIFGSVVTGLALRNSDVDCLVNLPTWLDEPRSTFVLEARKLLRRNKKFQNIFAITKAKVPIVQFTYTPTNTHCDVSFSSRAGIRNSKLLEYLISSDERILPLTVLVKYWSKVHSFTGRNLMSSYSLTLLFIFYLQQINILPSIQRLQENEVEVIVDNWNTCFAPHPNCSTNREQLYPLLGGFFKYYQNFNFKKYVISLYTAQLIERERFLNLDTVPEEFCLYRENVSRNICEPIRLDTVMCIQDPFNHARNCGVSVHPRLAQTIIHHFKKAATLFDREPMHTFLRSLLQSEHTPHDKIRPHVRNISAKSHTIRKNKPMWTPRQFLQNGNNFRPRFSQFHRNK